MLNSELTVISVTYNNREGLRRTLDSILNVRTKPAQIIIIDGGSVDGTHEMVEKYKNLLPVVFLSDKDEGIYDAMNKGKMLVSTNFIHYLNGGDEIFGDPYFAIKEECRLPVCIYDPITFKSWFDRLKLGGFGYCHQGVIFKSSHDFYETSYELAADFDLIVSHFPFGLKKLPVVKGGWVRYQLGGVSSIRSGHGDSEIIEVSRRRLGILKYAAIRFEILIKNAIPRKIRRAIFAR